MDELGVIVEFPGSDFSAFPPMSGQVNPSEVLSRHSLGLPLVQSPSPFVV
jgi:hypothetical protein